MDKLRCPLCPSAGLSLSQRWFHFCLFSPALNSPELNQHIVKLLVRSLSDHPTFDLLQLTFPLDESSSLVHVRESVAELELRSGGSADHLDTELEWQLLEDPCRLHEIRFYFCCALVGA